MKPVCHHIGLFVNDIEKTTRFYVEELGFKLERDYAADQKMMQDIFSINSSCQIRYLTLRGFSIELFFFHRERLNPPRAKQPGLNHWTILVEDKDAFCAGLAKKGIKVITIPKPHGFTYFIKDPELNLIEVKSHELKSIRKAGY